MTKGCPLLSWKEGGGYLVRNISERAAQKGRRREWKNLLRKHFTSSPSSSLVSKVVLNIFFSFQVFCKWKDFPPFLRILQKSASLWICTRTIIDPIWLPRNRSKHEHVQWNLCSQVLLNFVASCSIWCSPFVPFKLPRPPPPPQQLINGDLCENAVQIQKYSLSPMQDPLCASNIVEPTKGFMCNHE